MRISQTAFDLIVAEEVGSQSAYERRYRRPTWPGESSGPTVGLGYDLGQTSRSTIISDWQGMVPDAMLQSMASASGKTGAAGKRFTAKIRSAIDIPWNAAIEVHRERVIPRWEAATARALPNTDKLSPDCFGALVSLTFNRGAALYTRVGDRYREMRAIKAAMASGRFVEIPGLIRAMKRVWRGRGVDGLLRRRDREAELFERGLSQSAQREDSPMSKSQDTPAWLATMRAIEGTHETPGGADNPTIMGWRDTISRAFPALAGYTRTYTHDSIPWCGLTVAYVMAANGIEPPATFLWARSWAKWGVKTKPRPGAVMVFTRNGGGHVALYEGETATQYIIRGGNQADAVNVTRIAKSRLLDARWPSQQPIITAQANIPIAGSAPNVASDKPSVLATLWRAIRGKDPVVPAPAPLVERPGLEPGGDPDLYDLQKQLADKGYVMVGMADGLIGPNTRSAVMTFRSEHGLPVNSDIDDALREAVAAAGMRPVSQQRAAAQANDLRQQGSVQVRELDSFGFFGKLLAGFGVLGGGIQQSGVLDQTNQTLQSVSDAATSLTSVIATVISVVQWMVSHWWLMAIGLGIYFAFRATTGVLNLVVLFRQGLLPTAK